MGCGRTRLPAAEAMEEPPSFTTDGRVPKTHRDRRAHCGKELTPRQEIGGHEAPLSKFGKYRQGLESRVETRL
jgi:hypothetical protein